MNRYYCLEHSKEFKTRRCSAKSQTKVQVVYWCIIVMGRTTIFQNKPSEQQGSVLNTLKLSRTVSASRGSQTIQPRTPKRGAEQVHGKVF